MQFLLELAARKNALPLPLFEERAALRLPPETHTLLGASYRITSQRNPARAPAAPAPIAPLHAPDGEAAPSAPPAQKRRLDQ